MPFDVATEQKPRIQFPGLPEQPQLRLAAIGGIAAAPLVAGALLPADSEGRGPTLCLLRHAVGIPCPFCGATRAFIEFGHGSSAWITSYNGFWVLVSLAALVLVAIAMLASWRSSSASKVLGERLDRLLAAPKIVPVLMLALVLPGWIWALTNRSTIV